MNDERSNREIDEMIRRAASVEVPAEVEARLRGRLAGFRSKLEQRPAKGFRVLADSLAHNRFFRLAALATALVAGVAVTLTLFSGGPASAKVYAAAVTRLKATQSLEYTIVLNAEPYVAVDFSLLAPAYRRVRCSWGIEVRSDGTAGKELVLMHLTRTYVEAKAAQAENFADAESWLKQLRSLPQAPAELLGARQAEGRQLLGFRVPRAPDNTSIAGLTSLDLWVDAATGDVHHVDIAIREEGKPPHQMHIQNIKVGGEIDQSVFDLTPPPGYAAIVPAGAGPVAGSPGSPRQTWALTAEIKPAGAWTAVVVPMQGPHGQAAAAVDKVGAYLKELGVAPAGPSFGSFASELHWEAGYPVGPEVRAEKPFVSVTVPESLAASAVIKAPWGTDSNGRWGAFLKSVLEQGYLPSGPAMEFWSGDDDSPALQSTEMRMAVTKAK